MSGRCDLARRHPVPRTGAAIVGALWLAGCNTVYQPPNGKPTAKIAIPESGLAWTCADGIRQVLARDDDGRVLVEAGERMTLGYEFSRVNGTLTQHCTAAMSFVPLPDRRYVMDFVLASEHCTDFVYLESKANRVGLELVPSIGRPQWCPERKPADTPQTLPVRP